VAYVRFQEHAARKLSLPFEEPRVAARKRTSEEEE